jgi:hypothetical protein
MQAVPASTDTDTAVHRADAAPPPPLFPSPSALEVVGMEPHHTHDMAQLLGESPTAAIPAAETSASVDAPPCFHCTVRHLPPPLVPP